MNLKPSLFQILLASLVFAMPCLADTGGFGSMMSDPVIAPDGTVLTLRSDQDHQPGDHEPGSGPMHNEGMELLAIDPSGSIAWSFEAGGAIHDVEIIDGLVIIAVVEGDPFGWWDGVDDESSSKVIALTLAAGTTVWELSIEEVIRSIETSADRVYAVSGMHGQHASSVGRAIRRPGYGSGHGPGNGPGSGPGSQERSLFAIGLDGTLLWTVPLDGN